MNENGKNKPDWLLSDIFIVHLIISLTFFALSPHNFFG